MIDFEVPEELDLIARTAREFAKAELEPHLRDVERDRSVGAKVQQAFREIGLAGLEVPEALGGAGLGAQARVLVNEELGAADPGAALALDPLGPALYPLVELGPDALGVLGAPLLEQEGARAILVWSGDGTLEVRGGRLTGSWPWIPSERVDLLVVLTPDEVFAVREGISLEPLRGSGLRAAGAASVQVDGAAPVARFRGAEGCARALARARLYYASLLVGVLRQAAEFSREYALGRVAFGKPIAHHQSIAFLITDMRSAVDGARLLLHEAAWRVDAGLPGAEPAATAYAEATDASTLVGPNAVQILGGHGFMQDYPVEKYMREARTLGLLLGGPDAVRDEAGRALCAGDPPVALSTVEA